MKFGINFRKVLLLSVNLTTLISRFTQGRKSNLRSKGFKPLDFLEYKLTGGHRCKVQSHSRSLYHSLARFAVNRGKAKLDILKALLRSKIAQGNQADPQFFKLFTNP